MQRIWNSLSVECRKELTGVALMIAVLAPFVVTGLATYVAGQYYGLGGAVLAAVLVAILIIMSILEIILWKICA
jgi:Mg2+/Co2+ transporter CorB